MLKSDNPARKTKENNFNISLFTGKYYVSLRNTRATEHNRNLPFF
jgi:hypothetical protein